MEEELKILKELGIATSTEVGEFAKKNIRNVIKGLNKLELYGEIKIMVFQSLNQKKRLYVTNEIYHNLCKIK